MFFGPPGSGKGTQADMLGEDLGLPVISVGELLRHERDAGTEIGKQVADKLAQGELVPYGIVEDILTQRLSRPDTELGYILDGYPREEEQLDYLEKRFRDNLNQEDKIVVVHISLDDEEIKRRISGRRVCDCGASYHLQYNPPKQEGICDLCGRELYQRKDDKPEVVESRLQSYHKRIQPLLDRLKKGYTVITINGRETIEEEKEDIRQALEKIW